MILEVHSVSTADDCLEGEQDSLGALTPGSPHSHPGRGKERLKHKNSSTNGKAGTERSGGLLSESLVSGFRLSGKVVGSVVVLRIMVPNPQMSDCYLGRETFWAGLKKRPRVQAGICWV